jgi:hypothetical protein
MEVLSMKFYYIEPEVAGRIGENSIIDVSVHPPIVSKLHYEFDGWLGDELLESFPCFIVSSNFGKALEIECLSGFSLSEVQISCSEQFLELYPNNNLPMFYWLRVSGIAGQDDFGISDKCRLVISDRTFDVARNFQIKNADLDEFYPC